MTPNRTEILHFRATPEEKQTIRENAGHAELALSEWMRQKSLDEPWGPDDGPTQPAVEEFTVLSEVGMARTAEGNVVREDHPEAIHGETYEQFMERRVGELVGDGVETTEQPRMEAEAAARAEWTER